MNSQTCGRKVQEPWGTQYSSVIEKSCIYILKDEMLEVKLNGKIPFAILN